MDGRVFRLHLLPSRNRVAFMLDLVILANVIGRFGIMPPNTLSDTHLTAADEADRVRLGGRRILYNIT